MKSRFFKILIPAAIVGLAVFFLNPRNATQTASPATGNGLARSKSHDHSIREARASKMDDSSPDAVLQRIPVADRASLWDGIAWNGQNPASLLDKQMGEAVTLEMGDGYVFKGKVIVKNNSSDGQRVIGVAFTQPAATMHVRVENDGSLFADLVPKDSLSAYRWTGSASTLTFTRMAQTERICSSVGEDDQLALGALPYKITGSSKAPVAAAAPPAFNSRPGAKGCIYLDFDGQTVTGSRWNTDGGGASIVAAACPYTEAQMTSICNIVAEDYAAFSITVCTSEETFNSYSKNRRIRVIVTPTDTLFSDGAGGIAYLNSWSDGSGDPCWVFVQNLSLSVYPSAIAASHEVGHTLGLKHDGQGSAEYYTVGNGAWGPIMGAPYDINIVQFSNGDYTGATNQEDDLAIISSARNGVGYVLDDHGNTSATATNLGKSASGTVLQSGLITTNTDEDYFSFTTTGGVCQLSVSSPATSPNLNAQVTLYDSNGVVLATNNPAPGLGCTINQVVAAGAYTFKVEGAAEGTYDTGGYSKYGSVGPYRVTGTVPGLGAGIATITEPTPDGVSIREGNGLFLNATAPGVTSSSTVLWKQVSGPVGGVTTFAPATALATRATFSKLGLYELQVQLTTGAAVSTDTVTVSVESIADPRVYSNLGPVITVNSPTSFFSFDADLVGTATDDGVPVTAVPKARWDVISGAATFANPNGGGTRIHFLSTGACKVMLSASDGQIRTFKEVSLNVYGRKVGAAVTGTPSKLLVPTNSSVDATWRDLAFNDAAWISKPLAIGYGNTTDFKAALVGGSNIKTLLYNKGTSTYTRVPFQIRSKDFVGGLKLQMKFDDGFVMYLNGTEILRNNVPAGAPAWNTLASSKRLAVNVAVPIEVDLSAYKSLLVDGGNVLAIHGVNFKKSDAEFLVAPSFEVQLIDTPYFRNVVEASALVPSLVEPSADADGDGTSNLVEHALGLNPFTANAPVSVLTPDGAGAVKMTLPLYPPADVQYILERSYDLTTWTPIATKSGTGAWSSNIVTVTTVSIASPLTTVRLLEASAPPSAVYRIRFVLSGPP